MKLLIVSDLHGSYYYLEKLSSIINNENIDKIIFLGDYFNYYEEKNEQIIEYLNSIKDKLIALKGNCDKESLTSSFNFKLHNYYLLEVDNLKLFLTHGNINYDCLIDDNTISVEGHTHVYNLSNNYINPGSISSPRKNKEHTYIMYSDNTFNLYDIDMKQKIKTLKLEGK